MWLLVDAGNTRLKWRLTDGERLLEGGGLAMGAELASEFRSVLAAEPAIRRVIASNVAGANAAHLIQVTVRETLGLEVEFVRPAAQFHGLRNGYAVPENLGTDRWVAMIGARQVAQGPICIVDCGTAVTLDWISAAGLHAGGMIIPGRRLMRDCLVAGTQQIQACIHGNEAPPSDAPGDATAACISAGTVACVAGMVEHTVRKLRAGGEVNCLVSGGDGPAFAAFFDVPHRLVPDLAFHGLLAYARG